MTEYEAALSMLARIKRVDIREGRAHRGRTSRGTWVVQGAQGSILELAPGRAFVDLDGERRAATQALERALESERLSLLRYLAGSPNEGPRVDPGDLRARQMELEQFHKAHATRETRRVAAWEKAEEADRHAKEASEALARANLEEAGAVRALQKARVQAELRREAAWYDALVQSTVHVEPATVTERADLPDLRLRM